MKKSSDKHFGICRLCKKEKILTFEHVPPQAVFNKIPMQCYDGNEVAKNPSGIKNKELRFHKKPRGSGGYYLCKECNSFTGGKYNKIYEKVANDFAAMICNCTNGIKISFKPMAWGAFFRQAMVMFVDISDICSNDDNLRRYLLDPDCTNFDTDKYKLFIFAANYKGKKLTKIIGKIIIDNLQLEAAEITSFPLGLFLLTDENRSLNNRSDLKDFYHLGVDITDLAKVPCDKEIEIEMTVPIHNIDGAESILEVVKTIQEINFLSNLIMSEKI